MGVIGGGFAGLSAATCLAKEGAEVTLFEKNSTLGGRARQFEDHGFKFDMGPSWYWMPEVFEKFFAQFGYSASDFYQLNQLNPSFRIYFGEGDLLDIPAEYEELRQLFDQIEAGSAAKLDQFMSSAQFKYDVGMSELVYRPSLSIMEYINWRVVKGSLRLQLLKDFKSYVKGYFKSPRLQMLMEFPVLFLGAQPKNTPALYSLMNYAGLKLGTYYPTGGFVKVIEAMTKIAAENQVEIRTNEGIEKIHVENRKIVNLSTAGSEFRGDAFVASADYHHIEQDLLDGIHRKYDADYWNSRVFAPSCLIFYLGLNKKVPELEHHNLFFDQSLDNHAEEIYETKKWPNEPLFYVCCPSKSDESVAPAGHENVFFLMPISIGLEDTEEIRERYFEILLDRIGRIIGNDIRDHIIYKKSYCISDFKSDYNAYKGNGYGLANTLMQTGIFKPRMTQKKVKNLFYAGQLTAPGPGVPPSIISGQVAADLAQNYLKTNVE